MQKLVSVKVGQTRHTFAFEGATMWDCTREANKHMFTDIPQCGGCGSSDLDLRAYFPQEEYKYLKVICLDCKASLTFGSPKKNPEVYYPRRNEDSSFKWEAYREKEEL